MENARAILSLENWLNFTLDNFDHIVEDEEKTNMMRIVIKKMPETFYTNFFHILTVNDNGSKMKKFILNDSELTALFSDYLDVVSGFTERQRTNKESSESEFENLKSDYDKISEDFDKIESEINKFFNIDK